jgi:hypothetical protein
MCIISSVNVSRSSKEDQRRIKGGSKEDQRGFKGGSKGLQRESKEVERKNRIFFGMFEKVLEHFKKSRRGLAKKVWRTFPKSFVDRKSFWE